MVFFGSLHLSFKWHLGALRTDYLTKTSIKMPFSTWMSLESAPLTVLCSSNLLEIAPRSCFFELFH